METVAKPRYQNNGGQLIVRDSKVEVMQPEPRKGFKSVSSAVSIDLNTDDKAILEWNYEAKRERECIIEIHDEFENMVNNLKVIERWVLVRQPCAHLHDRQRIPDLMMGSSDVFGSQMTIASDISNVSRLTIHEKREMVASGAFTRRPQSKPTPKETKTYCPAGYERDLHNFKKYNTNW